MKNKFEVDLKDPESVKKCIEILVQGDHFRGASLCDADFTGAVLEGTNLQGANLNGVREYHLKAGARVTIAEGGRNVLNLDPMEPLTLTIAPAFGDCLELCLEHKGEKKQLGIFPKSAAIVMVDPDLM